MAIPKATFYHDGNLDAGVVATYQDYTVNSLTAGQDVKFGQAVTANGGKGVPATKGPIYGVAIVRDYTHAEHFTKDELEADSWKTGETMSVMIEGSVSVPVSSDVNEQDLATVDSNGLFKTAGANDFVVGRFLTDGNKDETATLQISQQLNAGK